MKLLQIRENLEKYVPAVLFDQIIAPYFDLVSILYSKVMRGKINHLKYIFSVCDFESIKSRTHDLGNMFECAAYAGDIDTMKYLVSIGADARFNRCSAFSYSAEHGHLESTKYLVSINAYDEENLDYVLIWVARNGHLQLLQYLLSIGADVHELDDLAFRVAVENNDTHIARCLIEAGANVHAMDEEALRIANSDDMLKLLLQNGADLMYVLDYIISVNPDDYDGYETLRDRVVRAMHAL